MNRIITIIILSTMGLPIQASHWQSVISCTQHVSTKISCWVREQASTFKQLPTEDKIFIGSIAVAGIAAGYFTYKICSSIAKQESKRQTQQTEIIASLVQVPDKDINVTTVLEEQKKEPVQEILSDATSDTLVNIEKTEDSIPQVYLEKNGESSSNKQFELRHTFTNAIIHGDIITVKHAIADGLDLQNDIKNDYFVPLQDVFTFVPDCQIGAEMIQLLLDAGASWPFTLENTLIINNKEIIRKETMTQYLKSHAMINYIQYPDLSVRLMQLIPLVDQLELQYGKKDTSDLHYFVNDENELLQTAASVEKCCKEVAYDCLFSAIEHGDVAKLKAIIALGVNPNYIDRRGITVLFHTVTHVPLFSTDISWEIMRMLFDAGARWTEKEFQKILDEEVAASNSGTMVKFLLTVGNEFLSVEPSNNIKKYSNTMLKLAKLIDSYELEHKLKTCSEFVE